MFSHLPRAHSGFPDAGDVHEAPSHCVSGASALRGRPTREKTGSLAPSGGSLVIFLCTEIFNSQVTETVYCLKKRDVVFQWPANFPALSAQQSIHP